MHNPDLAVMGGQTMHQQPQTEGASQRQEPAGNQVQLFEGFGAIPGQEMLKRPFDSQPKNQDHAAGNQPG